MMYQFAGLPSVTHVVQAYRFIGASWS